MIHKTMSLPLFLLPLSLFAAGLQELPPESRTVLSFVFGENRSVEFKTGKGKEGFAFFRMNGSGISCRFTDETGKSKNILYRMNGSAKRNFAWNDNLLGWSSVYEKISAKDLSRYPLTVTLENRSDETVVFLNGTALQVVPLLKTLILPEKREVNMTPPVLLKESAFRMIDIAQRFNASDGMKIPECGEVEVGGVPFRLAPGGDWNHIDLSVSWFREGMLTSYEEPQTGSFGGRWFGALGNDPTRIQFRVPNEEYDSLCLLAAFDGKPDRVPYLTAQFFRASAGAPVDFVSGKVPAFSESGGQALPVKDEHGKTQYLHCIRIPLSPARLKELSDLPLLDFELTKLVQTYVAWPDAFYYSRHGAGLPSGVRIYAATLGKNPLPVDFTPDSYANIWTAPSAVSYTATLTNRTKSTVKRKLELSAASLDRLDRRIFTESIEVPPGKTVQAKFRFTPKRYGHYDLELSVDGAPSWKRTLAYLRPRSHEKRSFDAPGFRFGFWNWRGEHRTPAGADIVRIAGPLGMETFGTGMDGWSSPEVVKRMQEYGMQTHMAFGSSELWIVSYLAKLTGNDEKDFASILNSYRKRKDKASCVIDPRLVRIFAEPSGIGTHGILPEFYGEPEAVFTPAQQKVFDSHHRRLALAARALKQIAPDVKLLMPHGDPVFTIPFLKKNDDVSRSFHGIAVDIGYFERLPEQQMHQNSLHRMYMVNHYWKKFRKDEPLHVTFEGPCIAPVLPGALTERELAAHMMRSSLILGAYGVNRQFTLASLTDSGDYWGEQHYGGGLISPMPLLNPHVACSAAGTLIRHLRDLKFDGFVPTGSLSAYCLRFRSVKDGGTVYAMWVIRGKREAKFSSPVRTFDAMDNESVSDRVLLSDLPVFVYQPGKFTLGEPDHSDSRLAGHHRLLGGAADLFTKQSQDTDSEYTDSFPEAIRRFPAKMNIKPVKAPSAQGGNALSVTLPEQEKDRGVMPFYTTLHPKKGIEIPGRASSLALWVKAHSDWGRIVYVLRDAKGEKWISCGSKGEWNADDMRNLSYFNFDGWRLLRFPLPSNAPYDNFREASSHSWGCSGGDSVVDLPLTLEKIFVERRPKAMYVNSLEKTNSAPVEFGNLYAEYDSEFNRTPEAVAQSKIRMPEPPRSGWNNPIEELTKKGVLSPSEISSVLAPESAADGTRAHFHFREMPGAVSYDLYVSPYADGAGAILLGKNLKKSGGLIRGFRADTDFHAFVVWHDKEKRSSVPSAPFRFRMQNQFGMR